MRSVIRWVTTRSVGTIKYSLRQAPNRYTPQSAVSTRLIVPTLCVVMPLRTLRVQGDAERRSLGYHAERGNNQPNVG